LLTFPERVFLAVFINEATTDPSKGPATEELHHRNIYYTDLSHLMTAYYWEQVQDQEGLSDKPQATQPPCPWPDRETAIRRDREIEEELVRTTKQMVS
jgi:hypothetical protein